MTDHHTRRPSPEAVSRRDLLAASAALGAGALLPGAACAAAPAKKGRRVLRIAHLTDTHVQPERDAGEGLATALHHVQDQPDRPDLVFFGGDNVMNVDGSDGAKRADVQLKTWNDALRNELSLPYRTCIGNHDVLRMHRTDGKKWAMDAYELDARHYHFDQAGWRFIVLDSTSPEGGGYKGRLDGEQLEWLGGVLKKTPASMPILILSHIPLIAACAYFDGDNETSGNWVVPGAWMHLDARRIKDMFRRHPNVKACLSGHIHLADQVVYNDVLYCCNGAVSGGWWGGPYQECNNGYGIVDLYDDGTVRNQYVNYPWTPRD
jgi:Icc protein